MTSSVWGCWSGVLLAYYVRYVESPPRLHSTKADGLILLALALMVVQGFLLEALRIQATDDPWAIFLARGLCAKSAILVKQ